VHEAGFDRIIIVMGIKLIFFTKSVCESYVFHKKYFYGVLCCGTLA
jgi:hypothetical protein